MNALAFRFDRPAPAIPPRAPVDDAIDTPRLVLREPVEGDIVPMTALADNVRIAARLPDMPHPYTISDAGRFIRRLRERANGLAAFAITRRDDGTLVGCSKIEAGEMDGESHLGLWIGESHWNRGYATEAAHALLDHAFSRSPRLITIRTGIRTINPAARRMLEKCGFQYAGPGAEADIRTGSLVPVDRYQIDRGIWSAIKGWSRADGKKQLLAG
jgi:RimJ/RimL family protein N-acetyltransferase